MNFPHEKHQWHINSVSIWRTNGASIGASIGAPMAHQFGVYTLDILYQLICVKNVKTWLNRRKDRRRKRKKKTSRFHPAMAEDAPSRSQTVVVVVVAKGSYRESEELGRRSKTAWSSECLNGDERKENNSWYMWDRKLTKWDKKTQLAGRLIPIYLIDRLIDNF